MNNGSLFPAAAVVVVADEVAVVPQRQPMKIMDCEFK
jgi:hypothetical protein